MYFCLDIDWQGAATPGGNGKKVLQKGLP